MKSASTVAAATPQNGIFARVTAAYLLLLTLLLPLKFGTIAVMPEATAYFPESAMDYLIINWPAAAFGIASGIGLLLAGLAFPRSLAAWQTAQWRLALLWSVGLTVLALPGFFRASTWDFPFLQVAHFAGVGAYAAAIYLYLAADPEKNRRRLLLTLAVGTLILTYLGLEQYFWGFEQSRQYILNQEAQGIRVGGILRARAFDDRVFATFTSCNSLAGYLLLVMPVCGALLWQWGGKFEPVKLSRILFLALGGGAMLAVLLLTKSRAAYLALVAAAGIWVLFWPMRRRWKWVLIFGAAVTVTAGALYIYWRGRGFLSMEARLDYLRSGFLLWLEHPISGYGWGEFFFDHMRIKTIESNEAAHDPHNLLLTATQAGTWLALLVSVGIAVPAWRLLQQVRRIHREQRLWDYESLALLFGLTAFFIHAQMDVHSQVAGIMAALVLVLLLMSFRAAPPESPGRPAIRKILVPGLVLLLLSGFSWWSNREVLQGEFAYDRLLSAVATRGKTPEAAAAVTPDRVRLLLAESVKARPKSSWPWSTAADFMLARGLDAEAESYLQEALTRAPKRASLYHRLAMLSARHGHDATARDWLEKARALFPNNPLYQSLTPDAAAIPGQ